MMRRVERGKRGGAKKEGAKKEGVEIKKREKQKERSG
jgi:hypothetical protein